MGPFSQKCVYHVDVYLYLSYLPGHHTRSFCGKHPQCLLQGLASVSIVRGTARQGTACSAQPPVLLSPCLAEWLSHSPPCPAL